MSWPGGFWRVGQATDPAVADGDASTATVSGTTPTSGTFGDTIVLTVNGTGFTVDSVIYATYGARPTTFVSDTELRCDDFLVRRGDPSPVPIGVKKQSSEQLSNTVNFTVV